MPSPWRRRRDRFLVFWFLAAKRFGFLGRCNILDTDTNILVHYPSAPSCRLPVPPASVLVAVFVVARSAPSSAIVHG